VIQFLNSPSLAPGKRLEIVRVLAACDRALESLRMTGLCGKY
jgi:hypothetical protein